MRLRSDAIAPARNDPTPSQRIDKWLWCARFVKTRTLAGKLAASGTVRLTRNGDTSRIEKASALIRIGDRLAFMKGPAVKIIEVNAIAARRGPAPEARLLYTDHSPPAPSRAAAAPSGQRDKGAGRPTKRERRALERVRRAPPE